MGAPPRSHTTGSWIITGRPYLCESKCRRTVKSRNDLAPLAQQAITRKDLSTSSQQEVRSPTKMQPKLTYRLFLLVPIAAAQLIDLGPEASADRDFHSSRFVQCNDFIQTCPPGKASCASVICQQCTMLGQTRLNACCSEEEAPTQCLKTALLVSKASIASTTATETDNEESNGPTATESEATGPATAHSVTMPPSSFIFGCRYGTWKFYGRSIFYSKLTPRISC